MTRLAALSVDLDEIPCYTAIHGLPTPRDDRAHAIYRRALPRLSRLFREEGIPATFFAIGADLEWRAKARALGELREQGHEIANHSYSHLYDFTRKPRSTIRDEIRRANAVIEEAVGEVPRGFRAPGYTITDEVFDVLEELGMSYDSSVFPCPAYYGAKTAAIGAIAARGRRSRSILGDPRVLTAPANPYRRGAPYFRKGEGLLELPIGVTRDRTGRLPFIGTSVVMSGPLGARLLTRMALGRPLVNLELHGIDMADSEGDELSFLARHQPDLRRSLKDKEAALRASIATLRDAGYTFVTLADAARRFAPRISSRSFVHP